MAQGGDEFLGFPVAEGRLKLIQKRFIDQQFTGAAAGDLGGEKVGPASSLSAQDAPSRALV